jgi:hypothetical protein
MDMQEGIHFVGAGDDGNRTAIELSRIYEGLRDGLFYEGHDEHQNHLQIHSFPFPKTVCLNWDHHAVILAGSVHDPCWKPCLWHYRSLHGQLQHCRARF